jgi:hypothetical protein
MATRVTTTLVDDTDGSEAVETLTFGIDSVQYELDLSEQNAKKLREALAPWVTKARKTGGRRSRSSRTDGAGVDLKAVRAWAASNDIQLSHRGRVPASVLERYRAAGN